MSSISQDIKDAYNFATGKNFDDLSVDVQARFRLLPPDADSSDIEFCLDPPPAARKAWGLPPYPRRDTREVLIRILDQPYAGKFVADYDPDGCSGRGRLSTTSDPTSALRFADVGPAMKCYRQQSTVAPLREDGRPNRPLTAFTVEFVLLTSVLKEV
jgi:hypothetical protein